MFVARFTDNPEHDIERGWSAYFMDFTTDLKEALETTGCYLDDETVSKTQAKWIRTYGEMYEDDATFLADYLADLAVQQNLRQDPHSGAWRPFHHDGLSCWALDATTAEDALAEAATRDDIDWGGFGQCTVGKVRLVGKVPPVGDALKDEFLYVFECEDVMNE